MLDQVGNQIVCFLMTRLIFVLDIHVLLTFPTGAVDKTPDPNSVDDLNNSSNVSSTFVYER